MLNDVCNLLAPNCVNMDAQYMKSRSNGKGVPFNDGIVEWMRLRLNESPKVSQAIGPLAKHEMYHLVCEARQWGVWRISKAFDSTLQRNAPPLVDCAQEIAAYMLRQLGKHDSEVPMSLSIPTVALSCGKRSMIRDGLQMPRAGAVSFFPSSRSAQY